MKKVFKKIGQVIVGAAALASILAGRAMATGIDPTSIGTSENPALAGAEAARASGMPADLIGADGVFTKITNTILYAVGIISVIMLILGGIRYVVSGGDSKKVTDAKNTIMYALIGMAIVALSSVITAFVSNAIKDAQSPSSNIINKTIAKEIYEK